MTKIPKKISRYEIIELIGKGTTGIIYKAYDPLIKRFVAIKKLKLDFILPEEQEEFIKRFYKEAQIAGTLNHPNIALIYDAGEYNNVPYICMEYIQGIPLNQWASENQNTDFLKNLLEIIKQTAKALDYAHSQGVIHRDIKPANILITENLQVKILDFGLALFANARTTKDGKIIGTPYYMAPEQVLGKKIDHHVDIFALGALTYELLTGRIPFYAESISAILSKIAYNEPDLDPELLFKELDLNEFKRTFSKALAKNPQERYPTASSFVEDLEKLFLKKFSEEITSEIPDIFEKTAKMDHLLIKEEIIGSEAPIAESQPTEETIIENEDTSAIPSPTKTLPDKENIIELEEKETIIVEEPPAEILTPKEIKKTFPFYIPLIILFVIIFIGSFYFIKIKSATQSSKLPLAKTIKKEQPIKIEEFKKSPSKIKTLTITIETIPDGAEAYQNNTLIGTTPIVLSNPSTKPLFLTLKKEGYENINFELKPLSSDSTFSLALPLKAPEIKFAELNIESEPVASNVYWRGKLIGKTPLNLKKLKPGKYVIAIEKEGYKKWEGEIVVLPDKTNELIAKLEKIEIKKPAPPKIEEPKKETAIFTKPEPINKVYPPLPSKVRIGGDVKLKLTVSEKGEVEKIEILSSPNPLLSEVAIKAAQKWTFKPATKNNKPIKGNYELIFRFQIK